MHRQYFWRGGIVNCSAMSGIDQALWDIKGKEVGKPVCELLGGPVRDTLRFYDHLGGGALEKRACSIIQPDVSHCGGISEARRIAAMAETYGIAVACHNP